MLDRNYLKKDKKVIEKNWFEGSVILYRDKVEVN